MIIVRESYCGKTKLLIYYSISILSTLISPCDNEYYEEISKYTFCVSVLRTYVRMLRHI